MFHERNAMGGGSPYVTGGPARERRGAGRARPARRARARGRPARRPARPRPDRRAPRARPHPGRARPAASRRACELGVLPDTSAAITRLMSAEVEQHGVDDRARDRRRGRRRAPSRATASTPAREFLVRQTGQHRRRHHRDGPQQHRRAGARHAPRVQPLHERTVPRRAEGAPGPIDRPVDRA